MDAVHELFVLEEITVARDGRALLDHVTAGFSEVGISVVVGPSGSGKTTLLRLLNRLDIPDSGRLLFRGRDIADIPASELRRNVAMVFQRPTMFEGTIRDNLAVAAPDRPDDAYGAGLARVGLPTDWLDKAAADLSGGEMQRLCIARALETRPEVVLMDEPTANLDEEAKLGIEQLAKQLAADGTPLIWVTHDGAQVARLADHVFRLSDGDLIIEGEHSV